MPKVSQSYLDNRRTQILDAAILRFGRQGFHRTTMQDIVAQSRLSPGAIYNYFKSKEAIIASIAEDRLDKATRNDSSSRPAPNPRRLLWRTQESKRGPAPQSQHSTMGRGATRPEDPQSRSAQQT